MRASWYAKAIHDLVETRALSEEKALEHVIGVVRMNGHEYMLPKIVRAMERIAQKRAKHETIEVITAEILPEKDVSALLKGEQFSKILSPLHKRVVRKVDPTLIGGTIVKTDSERIDMSYKRMLQEIYQHMTNTL